MAKKQTKTAKKAKNTIVLSKNEGSKKRYLAYGAIYLICAVAWVVIGYIKMDNRIDMYYLDYICAALLVVLSVVYFIRYKTEK